jgi:hypothetical protein
MQQAAAPYCTVWKFSNLSQHFKYLVQYGGGIPCYVSINMSRPLIKSFVGVQGAVFQKSPLVAEGMK